MSAALAFVEPHEAADTDVDVLFFDVGAQVYGVDASQVLRIDRSLAGDLELPELGQLHRGNRALVYLQPDGAEGHLRIDAVRGVRAVPLNSLRRMPAAAFAAPYLLGAVLEPSAEGDAARTVLLVDLAQMTPAGAPAPALDRF